MSLPYAKRNTWYKIPNQNLSVFMRDAGFDMTIYPSYSENVREEAKRKSIVHAIRSLRTEFAIQTGGHELKELKHGVYTIRLADGMCIKYPRGNSPLIYIGQGAVEARVRQHYHTKLFKFLLSLNGINFDFFVCEPWRRHYRGSDFHKQIEFELIRDFGENYGGLSSNGDFPLMNKIAGSPRNLEVSSNWWRTPLKRSGTKTEWVLSPGPNSEFVASLE